MKRLTRWAGAALLLTLAVAACDTGDDLLGVDGEPSLSLYITDAPGDVAAVWVEITSAVLHGEAGQVVVMSESTGLVEVTTLVGVAQELVDDVEVPAGRYGKLSLIIGDAVLETTGGEVYVKDGAAHPDGLEATGTLKCPSCSKSGMKVQLHGVEIGGDDAIVMDFDVAQTFGHQAGKSGMWIMRPVIHTTFVDGGDDDVDGETVSIEGEVLLADGVTIPQCPAGTDRSLEDFLPLATAQTLVDDAGAAVVRSGSVDEDGEFEFSFVEPDTYDMGFDAVLELGDFDLHFEATVDPAQVTVADADVEGVTYTITGATCEAAGG